ncbi:MAG: hypothetical protein NTY22_01615 [Proteobacteria bacterium]|nr:hypothetical protein [Pseudomonadota bacterium]
MRVLFVLLLVLNFSKLTAQENPKDLTSTLNNLIASEESSSSELKQLNESLTHQKNLFEVIINLYDLAIDTNDANIKANGKRASIETNVYYTGAQIMKDKWEEFSWDTLVKKIEKDIAKWDTIKSNFNKDKYSVKEIEKSIQLLERNKEVSQNITNLILEKQKADKPLDAMFLYILEQMVYQEAQMKYIKGPTTQHDDLYNQTASAVEKAAKARGMTIEKGTEDSGIQTSKDLIKAGKKFAEARRIYQEAVKK